MPLTPEQFHQREADCNCIGIRESVPMADYQQWPGVSPSKARPALESALAYAWALEHRPEPTEEMKLGSACHTALWEPDELPLRCVVWKGPRRGKDWKRFESIHPDKLILTADQWTVICRIRDRLQKHPGIKAILELGGKREVSMAWWRNMGIGAGPLLCRGRIDYLAGRIYDLKTAYKITDHAIASVVADKLYHMQMAAYQEGYRQCAGEEKDLAFIFAQTKPPYDARVVTLVEPELGRGHELWQRACETIARAAETGEYPGMNEAEVPVCLPAYAMGTGEEIELTMNGEAVTV